MGEFSTLREDLREGGVLVASKTLTTPRLGGLLRILGSMLSSRVVPSASKTDFLLNFLGVGADITAGCCLGLGSLLGDCFGECLGECLGERGDFGVSRRRRRCSSVFSFLYLAKKFDYEYF